MPSTMSATPTVAAHFQKSSPPVAATYAALLKASRQLGPVREDPKKTSIHLVRETAFAGVATRKDALNSHNQVEPKDESSNMPWSKLLLTDGTLVS